MIGKGYRGGTGYFYYALAGARGRRHPARVHRRRDRRRPARAVRAHQASSSTTCSARSCWRTRSTTPGCADRSAVEVRRAQGEQQRRQRVSRWCRAAVAASRCASTPGAARGWDARSYPFVAESTDAYGPLLLPWNDARVQLSLRWPAACAGSGPLTRRARTFGKRCCCRRQARLHVWTARRVHALDRLS